MKLLGNILWLVFGGFETALGYFSGALGLAATIIGIPWAIQIFKLGLLCLWPFGAKVTKGKSPSGCLKIIMDIVWLVCGGFWAWLGHIGFGVLLYITIIGIPWGKQHFKMAGIALAPFGKNIKFNI